MTIEEQIYQAYCQCLGWSERRTSMHRVLQWINELCYYSSSRSELRSISVLLKRIDEILTQASQIERLTSNYKFIREWNGVPHTYKDLVDKL